MCAKIMSEIKWPRQKLRNYYSSVIFINIRSFLLACLKGEKNYKILNIHLENSISILFLPLKLENHNYAYIALSSSL